MGHLVVEKADGGEVSFDGAGRLALRLQIEDIAHQMLAADVLQLLQVVVGGEVGAESLDRLVVAVFRAEAALSVVASQLVQLGNEGVVNAFCGHIKKSPCNRSRVQMDALHPLARRAISGVSPQNDRLPQAESLGAVCFSRSARMSVSLYLYQVSTLRYGGL